MPPRRCRHCRQLVAAGVRCPCQPNTRTGYDATERRRRADLVALHLEAYGPVCPGWHRTEHVVEPRQLSADHIVAVAQGGDQRGPLQVLCRPCNSAKGSRS